MNETIRGLQRELTAPVVICIKIAKEREKGEARFVRGGTRNGTLTPVASSRLSAPRARASHESRVRLVNHRPRRFRGTTSISMVNEINFASSNGANKFDGFG